MTFILDTDPSVGAFARGRDLVAVGERADLGAAGAPGVADVQRACCDIARAAEIGDRHVDIIVLVDDRRAQNDLKVILPQPLEAAEEHRHRLLPGGIGRRVQRKPGRGLCAVDVFALDADLCRLDRPAGEGTGVDEFGEIRPVDRRVIGDCVAEVLDDLEELLPRQRLVGAEGAIRVAAHNAELIRLENDLVGRIGEVVRPFKLDGVLGDERVGVNGESTHFRAGDVLFEIIALKRRGDEIELLHFVVAGLEPVTVVFAADGGCADSAAEHHRRAQREAQQLPFQGFHIRSSFSSNPIGQ